MEEKYLKENLIYDVRSGLVYRKTQKGWRVIGTKDDEGYLNAMIKGKKYRIHRLAWFLYYGKWPELHLDHVNRIKTDNRVENLRECDDYLNAANTPKMNVNNSSSKYKGVGKHKGKWRARIKHYGKRIEIGHFATEEEAFEAYAEKAKELHGKYVNLSFRDGKEKSDKDYYTKKMIEAEKNYQKIKQRYDETFKLYLDALNQMTKAKSDFDRYVKG